MDFKHTAMQIVEDMCVILLHNKDEEGKYLPLAISIKDSILFSLQLEKQLEDLFNKIKLKAEIDYNNPLLMYEVIQNDTK